MNIHMDRCVFIFMNENMSKWMEMDLDVDVESDAAVDIDKAVENFFGMPECQTSRIWSVWDLGYYNDAGTMSGSGKRRRLFSGCR